MNNELGWKDICGENIDPVWAAEFRGFFFGEGYVGITTNGCTTRGRGGKKYTSYMARIQITIRDDDRAILDEIHRRLGGYFGKEKKGRKQKGHVSKPCVVWRVRKKEEVERILSILEGGTMPSKKRQQMKTLREFLKTVNLAKPGPKSTQAHDDFLAIQETRRVLHQRMLELHDYAA